SEPDGEPPVFSTEYGEVILPEPAMKAAVGDPQPIGEKETAEGDGELRAALGKPNKLAWIRNAVPAPKTGKRPMITIVVDDLGLSLARSERVFALKPPLTLAFLPYAGKLAQQSRQALEDGHELLLHLPMEPENGDFDPGPRALMIDSDRKKTLNDLQWNLGRFSGYVGINNHMGSRFTADRKAMKTVMGEVRKRGLLYLDSLTTNASVGPGLAREMEVPYAVRHVFLDNVISYNAIRDRLKDLEKVAREQGFAIGICHPHDATIQALSSWLKTLDQKGLVLVPLSSIVLRRMEIRGVMTEAKVKG
ncbi:MAG: divergent polysaccharide deacetylase family protein, partial [Rhodospirillaceae bacterium]|nr:divergent polysaccharide deacetylase family protein [Rhodospirillaceae bacterium]